MLWQVIHCSTKTGGLAVSAPFDNLASLAIRWTAGSIVLQRCRCSQPTGFVWLPLVSLPQVLSNTAELETVQLVCKQVSSQRNAPVQALSSTSDCPTERDLCWKSSVHCRSRRPVTVVVEQAAGPTLTAQPQAPGCSLGPPISSSNRPPSPLLRPPSLLILLLFSLPQPVPRRRFPIVPTPLRTPPFSHSLLLT